MKRFLVLSFVAMLSACAGLQPVQTIPGTNQFSTYSSVEPGEIKTYVANDRMKDYRFIFLYSLEATTYRDRFHKYLDGMLSNQKIEPIVRKSQIEDLYIATDRVDDYPDLSSRIGHVKLSKQIGPYLFFLFQIKQVAKFRYVVEATILDPRDEKVYLHIFRDKSSLGNFDKEIMMPVLNKIGDWYRESSAHGSIPLEQKIEFYGQTRISI